METHRPAASNWPSSNGKPGMGVEVLDDVGIEPGIGGQFPRVHPDSDHLGISDFRRQVAHPRTHQVQHATTRREVFAVELRDGGNGRVVDVRDQTRRGVEGFVGRFVRAAKPLGAGEHQAMGSRRDEGWRMKDESGKTKGLTLPPYHRYPRIFFCFSSFILHPSKSPVERDLPVGSEAVAAVAGIRPGKKSNSRYGWQPPSMLSVSESENRRVSPTPARISLNVTSAWLSTRSSWRLSRWLSPKCSSTRKLSSLNSAPGEDRGVFCSTRTPPAARAVGC